MLQLQNDYKFSNLRVFSFQTEHDMVLAADPSNNNTITIWGGM
jgi:hypothetical protein